MKQTIIRWTIHVLALCVLGPVAGLLIASLRATDGGPHATLLVGDAPVRGMVMGLLALLLAGGLGVATARIVDARAGLFAAGVTLAWAAARSGRVDVILRARESSDALVRLAVEGVVVGAFAVVLAGVVYAVGKPEAQVGEEDAEVGAGRTLSASLRRVVSGPGVLAALPVALVAGAAAAWFIAVSPLKGQTIAAGVAAGIIGGAAGRVADSRVPAQTFMLAIALLAVAAPVSAFVFQRGTGPVDAAYAGSLFALARIAPLDWVAGGLLGVPLGVAWAGSLIDKRAA